VKLIFNFKTLCFLVLAPSLALADPQITLPPEDASPTGIKPGTLQLPRENLMEVPLEQPAMQGTAVGGYGELTLNAPSNSHAVVDLRRLVLYFGHNFNAHIRFYGEIEAEHAVTSSDDKGEFEIEQAFLDYVQWRFLNFRLGVIIVPVGIINVYHEPPTFNGVDRPLTDQLIIPSTWREPGGGFFGEVAGFRYQAYAVNGFNASGFSASTGLREGHQEAQLAFGKDWGIVARVEYLMPILWRHQVAFDLGVSFYWSDADQGQAQFKGTQGDTIPVTLIEADLRIRTRGLELRSEIASVWIGGIHRLNRALEADAIAAMEPFDGPVAHQLLGGYVELGYDLLHQLHLKLGTQLVAFMRYEHVDTQFSVPADLGQAPGNRQDVLTAGFTLRIIPEVAIKLDYQRFWTNATSSANRGFNSWNAGLAFMF
jgi:hypothetical protein